MIVEVAARNQLLKMMGHHSALDFQNRVQKSLDFAGKKTTEWSMPAALSRDVIEEEVE